MQGSDLLAQLAQRTRTFKEKTGLSSRQICKLTNITEQGLCDFLANRKGLSAESAMRLSKLTRASKAEVTAKLGSPKNIQIEHFQSNGEDARFDWVPGQGGSDPVNSTSIVDTPTFRDSNPDDYQVTWDFLTGQQEILRSADKAIEDWRAT